MAITEADVLSALKQLTDPNTKKDFVSGKSVKNIKISGERCVTRDSARLSGEKRVGRNQGAR